MSEDKNLNNNSEEMFMENRRKKVEKFKMNINPSSSLDLVEENSHFPERGEHFSDNGVNSNSYDLNSFSEKPNNERYDSGDYLYSNSGNHGEYAENYGQNYDSYNNSHYSAEYGEQLSNSGERPVDVVSDIRNENDYMNFSNDPVSYEEGYTKKQQKRMQKLEKKRMKKNKKTFKYIWLLSTLVMGIILGQFLVLGFNDMLAVNRQDDTTVHVEIGADPTLDEVASILQENHVIDSELFFKLYVSVTGSADGFRQGSFDMGQNMDYEQIVNYMQSNLNRTDIVTVQLYEGMNALEIADKLEEEGVLTDREKFFELLNSDIYDEDYPFLQNVSSEGKYYRLEGYLFPDTYDFYKNEDPETTIERFLSNYEKRICYTKYENENYEKDVTIEDMINDSQYSMDEIMIIASIIQAEAADVEDMYNVSSVLHNRLESHIDEGLSRLDCDSTVYYPYRSKSAVPEEMGDYMSNYNTYEIYGLPAGAICNPSLDAIMAALYPNDTNYYYFCHSAPTEDSPSVAYYATNAYDHNRNLVEAGLVEE